MTYYNYEFTGEVRIPKLGEHCLTAEQDIVECQNALCGAELPIYRRVEIMPPKEGKADLPEPWFVTYERTGEVRLPKAGEAYYKNNGISTAGHDFSQESWPIYKPVDPARVSVDPEPEVFDFIATGEFRLPNPGEHYTNSSGDQICFNGGFLPGTKPRNIYAKVPRKKT